MHFFRNKYFDRYLHCIDGVHAISQKVKVLIFYVIIWLFIICHILNRKNWHSLFLVRTKAFEIKHKALQVDCYNFISLTLKIGDRVAWNFVLSNFLMGVSLKLFLLQTKYMHLQQSERQQKFTLVSMIGANKAKRI